jgi:hypothetical protein
VGFDFDCHVISTNILDKGIVPSEGAAHDPDALIDEGVDRVILQ